jgi:hypothetical protein
MIAIVIGEDGYGIGLKMSDSLNEFGGKSGDRKR